MTEITSTSSVGSDGSLVLIEATDAIPTAVATEEEAPPAPTAPSEEENPNAVAETYSYNSEASIEEQREEPLIASAVHVVDDVPSSMSVSMSTIPSTVGDDFEDNESVRERKVGAGIAVGILAAPFCGPVLAVVAGVAAAYGTSQPGAAGDACRAAGEIALVAKEKAIEVDRKHDIVNKTKDGASQIIDKARDENERHRIFQKVQEVMACTLKNIAAALQFAAEKVKESSRKEKNAESNSVKEAYSYEKVSLKTEGN